MFAFLKAKLQTKWYKNEIMNDVCCKVRYYRVIVKQSNKLNAIFVQVPNKKDALKIVLCYRSCFFGFIRGNQAVFLPRFANRKVQLKLSE